MAVKLRLARLGKKSHPYYRLVAIDEHSKRGGRAIEVLGTYDPASPERQVSVQKDRITYWLSVGAIPTTTVKHLLKIFV